MTSRREDGIKRKGLVGPVRKDLDELATRHDVLRPQRHGRTWGRSEALLSIKESIPLVVVMVEANRGKPGLRYVDRFNGSLP